MFVCCDILLVVFFFLLLLLSYIIIQFIFFFTLLQILINPLSNIRKPRASKTVIATIFTLLTAAIVRFAPIFNLKTDVFQSLLSNYPYELDKNYAIDAINNGYNIGVEFNTHYSVSTQYNWIDEDKAYFITDWLLHHKSIIGPFSAECAKLWNIDTVPPFAVEQNNKFRPITDFSYPRDGTSLNENLYEELCTVTYVRFEEVVELIQFR